MSSTPLWVPLVVAGIGVMGTLTAGIAGGVIAQRWANQREDKTWARERARERERWAREDEARTFEHRREVFEEFYQAVKALARRAYDHGYGFDDTPELPFDWNADAFAKLTRLGLYAVALDGRFGSGALIVAPGPFGVLHVPSRPSATGAHVSSIRPCSAVMALSAGDISEGGPLARQALQSLNYRGGGRRAVGIGASAD